MCFCSLTTSCKRNGVGKRTMTKDIIIETKSEKFVPCYICKNRTVYDAIKFHRFEDHYEGKQQIILAWNDKIFIQITFITTNYNLIRNF